ncbi:MULTISPECIES: RNA polymerase sigma factor [Apibacter]|uniref:RNA polymerase sigma factor n=1 Tax=Apibacter TaxID=1778601 RepID=UPI000CF91795|nr:MULTISPECIES: RNA polymerase sigma factor [Apibacter]MCX8677075.1 RNA polymerase sigma factor [Apibacter sp. B3919]MXO24544.1 sigma-70 family RNA polymerase sigma factor [Apibacter sp. B3924]MXO25788.1 sigma-70 family RNA polymerase sigma factor [Apibacter sp. B3813]MXO27739.1 sigma-70 family RNA polymerase sigma factor [Apibacter sp. B3913]MXO29901.1 sigma-70 family RNA polymerase sigma factor [Apibacter sp. B3912]
MIKRTDCELVHSYINGNENALKTLLDRHKLKIYNYINRKVNNPELAEDLFQDVFIKVILTLKEKKYNEEGKFLPWVLRISHNLIIDHFRVSNKTKIINESSGQNEDYNIFDFVKVSELSIEDLIINEQINLDLKRLINELSEDQKEVLELRFYKGLSFKEIAEETNVGINTALGRMRYAILNLRKLIETKNLTFIYNNKI